MSSNAVQSNAKMSLYIPRISANHTEKSVIDIFHYFNVGHVDYVDFVAIKEKGAQHDPNKSVKFYSAHVKMHEWNPRCDVYDAIKYGEKYELTISKKTGEYWIILPSKTEAIPRTKVNIHQLSEYTRELFENDSKMTVMMDAQSKVIADQQAQINALCDMNTQLMKRLAQLEAKMVQQEANKPEVNSLLSSEEFIESVLNSGKLSVSDL